MIRTTCRRAATIVAVAAAVTVAGLPLFSGTALAATVTPSPNSAANSGTATVTLTGGATMWTATGATLVNHDNSSVTIPASALSTGNPVQPTTRTAQFPLSNKLPGVYDITVAEPTGNETCTSCFTIVGLPPTISIAPPSNIVAGSTADGSLTFNNPARGYDYAKSRIQIVFSALVGLHASNMTLQAEFSPPTWTPISLADSSGDVVGFIGSAAGTHAAPGDAFVLPLRFGATSDAPTGPMHVTANFGDVNTTTGALTDTKATDETDSKISTVAAGSKYTALTPVRVLDTRVGTGHTGALPPRGRLTLVLGGTHSIPTSATAVAMNITATGGTSHGFLVAYPSGPAPAAGSNVNYPQGGSAANVAVVPLNATTHSLVIANGSSAATVHVVGDVLGYYSSSGAVYNPVAPARVLDTRTTTPIPAGGTRTVTIAGHGGVPATGATVAVLNITATRGQSHGFLRVFPAGGTDPGTSNVNFGANQTIANLDLAQLSSDGRITIANHSGGTVHVIVDVQGYYTPTGSVSSLHPTTITRVLDTRSDGSKQPLAGGASLTVTLGGKSGLPASGITMVAVNLTVTAPQAGGHITAYAQGASVPTASNANFSTGQTIANLAYVKTNDSGGITIVNGSSAPIHLIIDIEGWGSTP